MKFEKQLKRTQRSYRMLTRSVNDLNWTLTSIQKQQSEDKILYRVVWMLIGALLFCIGIYYY